MPFSSLGLSEPLIKAILKQKYQKPYPIQEKAIPAILAGKDIFGIAPTGSGKTASFVLPVLQLLEKSHTSLSRHVKVLVLVPTRELAIQAHEVFQNFNAELSHRHKCLAVYGGVSINPQMIQMQGTHVLIATPGRLLDLVSSNAVHLSSVEILILDEADKMLNLGFKEEMAEIFELLPDKRQNLLFSATQGDAIQAIQEKILKKPVIIQVESETQNLDLITQTAYAVSGERKGVLLRYLIKNQNMQQVLVFVSSTHRADHIVVKLRKNGIDAAALHGKKSQGTRMDALKKFKSGQVKVLVATDLASRGIDIQFLPFVINYELPRSPLDYVHRIGRTGRAESPGEAMSLITPEELHHFQVIQKKIKKQISLIPTEDWDLKGF